MSNEVKIIVTSDDNSNLSAIERKFRASGKSSGDQFSRAFTGANAKTGSDVGRKIGDDATEQINRAFSTGNLKAGERLADNIAVGAQHGRNAIEDLKGSIAKLDERVVEHKRNVEMLGAEYARSGNEDVFKAFRNARSSLANLQSVRKELTGLGDDSGKVGDQVEKELKNAGKRGVESLNAGLLEGKARLMVAGAGLAAVFVGAINAAIMAGGGVGTVGLAALFLKEEPAIRSSAIRVAASMKNTMREAAQPMVGPLLTALKTAQTRVAALGPILRSTFANANPMVMKLVDAVSRFVGGVLPSFNRMLSRSGPVMDAVGDSAQTLGEGLGKTLDILTSDPQAAADSLRSLATVVSGVAQAVAWAMKLIQSATHPVTAALGGMKGMFRGVLEGMSGMGGNMGKVAKQALAETDALDAANASTGAMTAATMRANEETQKLARATGELSSELLAASGSAIATEEAIDAATAAIRKNGRTLDINTEKGRANRTALDGIANAALKEQESMKAAGASTHRMSERLGRAYNAFVKAAIGAGKSKSAADRLARSYGLLPHAKSTRVRAPGAIQSKAQVDALWRSIKGLKGKTVRLSINTVYRTYGSASALAAEKYRRAGLATGGVLSRAATGGPRELVEVGEEGPETVDTRSGIVYPTSNARVRGMATAAQSPARVVLELKSSGRAIDDLLIRLLRDAIHVRGGNVQLVLGR